MQVSSTLIAAQQAAREAQARFQSQNVAPQAAAKATPFAAVLGGSGDFSPLPLKQTAASVPAAAPAPAEAMAGRPGSLLDIRI